MKSTLLFLLLAIVASAAERTPWTSSKVKGSPDPPPPYVMEQFWPHLQLNKVLEAVYLPHAGQIFLVGIQGKIISLPADLGAIAPEPLPFADLSKAVPQLKTLFGMVFHPRHADNHQVFLFYVDLREDGEPKSRIGRFKTLADPLRLDPASEEILVTFGAGGHNGGHLQFGPDGMLYFAVGDLEVPSPPDPRNTGQDLSDLAGSIMRIDVDGRSKGMAYRIPADNPFVKVPNARPEIWAYGLRNPWKICFHHRTGDLWVADVGWESWELLHKVERGGNYGWSIIEGPLVVKPNQSHGPSPISPPVVHYSHTEGASITGGYVSETKRLPKLKGAYLYGDYVTGRVWAMWHDGKKLLRNEAIADTRQRIVSFGQAAAGEVFFFNWPNKQKLFRFVPNPEVDRKPSFPDKLSQTGVFDEIASEQPAPGVHEFSILAPMWQDGAIARYWLGLPGKEPIGTVFHKRRDSLLLRYDKPKDTVLAKTLYRDDRRIETQLLHFDGNWRGYTFQWDDEQTDATLVPKEGRDVTIEGKPWRFPSRQECLRCHGGNFNHVFAFFPGQLNHDDQLKRFREMNLVGDKFLEAAARQPLVSPYDDTAPLEKRARSWLHANCAHCHRVSGGGSVPFRTNVVPSNDELDLFDETPVKGGFGLDEPKLIASGNPYSSVLYYRCATTGAGHMPMLGAKTIDVRGLRVLHDWIRSLHPSAQKPSVPKTIKTTSDALRFAHLIDAGELDEKTTRRILESADQSESAEIQGIFQRFEPFQ